MDITEIRYDKRKLIPLVIFLGTCILGSTYLLLFTKTFDANQNIKFIIMPLNLFSLFLISTQIKRLLNNKPVLTFTNRTLEINEDGKLFSFSWREIKEITIVEKQSGKSHIDVLTVKSESGITEVNIGPLDRNSDDILELIKKYRK